MKNKTLASFTTVFYLTAVGLLIAAMFLPLYSYTVNLSSSSVSSRVVIDAYFFSQDGMLIIILLLCLVGGSLLALFSENHLAQLIGSGLTLSASAYDIVVIYQIFKNYFDLQNKVSTTYSYFSIHTATFLFLIAVILFAIFGIIGLIAALCKSTKEKKI